MKTCIVDGVKVAAKLITPNSFAFGKPISAEFSIPFHLELDANDAIADFNPYYQAFVDRESEDEGFDEAWDGYFLLLKETGYLSFEEMIFQYPILLAQIIRDELPAEFLGYVFLDQNAPLESKKYILQNLIAVDINNGKIICTGYAFLNPKYLTKP